MASGDLPPQFLANDRFPGQTTQETDLPETDAHGATSAFLASRDLDLELGTPPWSLSPF